MHILTDYIRFIIHFPGFFICDRKEEIWPIRWAYKNGTYS
jgi:hypothetical protein